MVHPDTFLTILYVMADDFCKFQLPPETGPGPRASLTRSEVVTLALFAQWDRFRSEGDFYRYAQEKLRPAFPTLPCRSQFNRLMRCHYEAMDSSAAPTRDAKRRGDGWLAGQADIGWSNPLGWSEGFHLLTSVNPQGVITGFSFTAASTKDQSLAEDFFAFVMNPIPPGILCARQRVRGQELAPPLVSLLWGPGGLSTQGQ